MTKYIFIATFLLFAACISGTAAGNPETVRERYISMALQADLSRAESLFDEYTPEGPSSEIAEFSAGFNARFLEKSENLSPGTGDAQVDAIVLTYRDYWVRTLKRELTVQEGVAELEASLRRLLEPNVDQYADGAATVFARIGSVLRDKGFYYLDTTAPPLRDLFLWKREETKTHTVRLTDRSQRVRVTFISEIFSMGWKEFATLGLVSTSGWVEGDRLYCVNSAYDRMSENFTVSYLKHESRHLADYERFPGLPSAELEYRAKLTELAFASVTLLGLLDAFTARSAPNPDSPHAMANYRVTRDLYREIYDVPFPESSAPWQNIDESAIPGAARRLLQRNTTQLETANKPE